MISYSDSKALVERILSRSQGLNTEVVFRQQDQQLSRYGANMIVQSVGRHVQDACLRVQKDGRQASTTLHNFDDASIDRCFEQLQSLLAVSRPIKDLLPIQSEAQEYKSVDAFAESALNHSPETRAETIAKLVSECKEKGYTAAGRYQIDTLAESYGNTHGLFAYHPSSNAVFSSTVTGPNGQGEGWATKAHHDPSKLDTDSVQSEAIDIATRSRDAGPLKPGRYNAILKPAAVSELVFFLARLGFNGQAFSEKRSYLKGELGGQHFGENVTITDNPADPRMPGRPWDLEGSPSDTVVLIDQGKATGLCWDRGSAAAHGHGQKTTGHSLQQPNNSGPQARNIIFEGNPDQSVDDLIAGLDNGILIQRFHYCNVVNPTELSITGMSRSGVFQVKDGVVSDALCNFRFTISIREVLSKIDALSQAVRAEGALFGARVVAPALRVHDFQITSTTEF